MAETIGTYRVLGKLGEGGMGVVYVGEHTLLGRRAAIKVLLPELSVKREIVHRFFNEAKAVTQITDPGIVQVFDFGYAENGSAYIVMELLEGEPMDRRLHRIGRFSPMDAVRMLRLIATSLSAAHAKGIVHRDLKPENIYLVGDPAVTGGERPKILDFGIAKLSGDEGGTMRTQTGVVMGTPLYMSPEQCRGAGIVDHRSDVYSLGCVAMAMLTGAPPFSGAGSGELIVQHMTARPPLAAERVPGMPPILDEILQACLAKDVNARFQSMGDLAQALARAEQMIVGGAAGPRASAPAMPFVNATPTTLSSAASQHVITAAQPPRSRAPLFAGLGAFVVIAGLGAAILASRGGKSSQAPAAAASPAPVEPAPPAPSPAVAAPAVVAPTPAASVLAQPTPAAVPPVEAAPPAPVATPPAEVATPAAPAEAPVATAGSASPPVAAPTAKPAVKRTNTASKVRTKPTSKTHAKPTGTTSTSTDVDRGD